MNSLHPGNRHSVAVPLALRQIEREEPDKWSTRKAVLVWFAVATLMWLVLIWGGRELWSLI